MRSLSYLLVDTARLMRRHFDARVRNLGVTSPQARLLLILSRFEGENQGFYAERLEVEPITLCRMVDRLEETNLVERRKDPADRRAWRLFLTTRSRPMIESLHACIAALEAEMLAQLEDAEAETLHTLLARMQHNLTGKPELEIANHG